MKSMGVLPTDFNDAGISTQILRGGIILLMQDTEAQWQALLMEGSL